MILTLRDTVEDVVDLLPGLLSWMLVGVANTCNSPMGTSSINS